MDDFKAEQKIPVVMERFTIERIVGDIALASSGELPRKKYATHSSINFQLCLLCEGDKFTKIEGVHQLEHLQQPELESYQQLLNCINNRA